MKFIKEHIEFKRGQDSKLTLNIGLRKYIPKNIEKLLRYDREKGWNFILSIEFNLNGDLIEVLVDDLDINYKEDLKYIKNLIKKFDLDKFINLSVDIQRKINIGTFTYWFWLTEEGKNLGIKNKLYFLDVKDDNFNIEKIKSPQNESKSDNRFSIKEYLGFKRGKDPKHSMNIGAIKILSQKWDELQQSSGTGGMNLREVSDRLFLEIYISHFPGSFSKNIDNVEKILGKEYFDLKKSYLKAPDRKSTRLNSSHTDISRMPSSA